MKYVFWNKGGTHKLRDAHTRCRCHNWE